MKKYKYRTDFLFGRRNFATGMGSVLGIAGEYYEFSGSDTAEEADARAIESDWGVIGQELGKALFKAISNSDNKKKKELIKKLNAHLKEIENSKKSIISDKSQLSLNI